MEKEILNVAIYCPYPLDKNGGVSDFVKQSIPYLEKEGCIITTIGPELSEGRFNPVDFSFGKKLVFKNEGSEAEVSRVFWDRGRSREILLEAKPDVINIQEPASSIFPAFALMEAAKWTPEPLAFVGTFHAQTRWRALKARAVLGAFKLLPYPRRREGKIRMWMARSIYHTAATNLDGKIAVSLATHLSWNKIFPGEYRIIPNGIDTGAFSSEGEEIDFLRQGKKLNIIFTGRHDERKGLEDLVLAYEIICQQECIKEGVKLVIVGSGQETEKIKSLVAEKNLPDVSFCDFFPRKDLPKLYRSANLFVSPSRYNEGFGRTLAEALSSGVPVVATKIPGFVEWLGDMPFAALSEPKDPEGLAKAIVAMLSYNKAKRKEMGLLGQRFIEDNYSLEKVAKKTVSYFRECLQKKKDKRQFNDGVEEALGIR